MGPVQRSVSSCSAPNVPNLSFSETVGIVSIITIIIIVKSWDIPRSQHSKWSSRQLLDPKSFSILLFLKPLASPALSPSSSLSMTWSMFNALSTAAGCQKFPIFLLPKPTAKNSWHITIRYFFYQHLFKDVRVIRYYIMIPYLWFSDLSVLRLARSTYFFS